MSAYRNNRRDPRQADNRLPSAGCLRATKPGARVRPPEGPRKTLHGDFQTGGVGLNLIGTLKFMGTNKAQTVSESITQFYCDKCKARRRGTGKPHVVQTKGRYVFNGDFVCGRCGFRLSTYCEICKKLQPVEIEVPWMDQDQDNEFLGATFSARSAS